MYVTGSLKIELDATASLTQMEQHTREAIRYLETQRDWIGHDWQWQEQGYPVGT
jgi:hypothetical protein